MKKLLSTLLVVFFATSLLAQTGLSCDSPIPVNSNYVGRVEGPCTLWYTAWSYDLPLNVHFIPDVDDSSWGPEVVVDFTCTPGVYDDPKLDSLLTMVEDFDVSFPITFACNLVTPNGKNEWNLSINQNYREMLAEYGITYNLQAFVKVIFEEAGVVSLRPDTAFQACMNNTPKINLGDTIEILPNDSNSAYIFSYTEWQEDSIRFVWVGDEPARVHLATVDCEFVPVENNGFIWNRIDMVEGTPYKLYTEQMKEDIKKNKAGGIYYGKVISPSGGKFVVEKIPMNSAQGGAIMLEHGKTIHLAANDTNTLYCFPRTWTATSFVASTGYQLTMYASPSYDFKTDDMDCYIFPFSKDEDGRILNLSSTEMLTVTDISTDDYVYVRFACKASTSITPEVWDASECADKSSLIRPNEAFGVFARSSNTIFRMRYVDWVGYDLTIQWGGGVKLPTYIADDCSFTLSANNSHVLKYAEIRSGGTLVIDAATIESWASRVDEDGYLYARFNPTNQGPVIFASSQPEEEDPEILYSEFSVSICHNEAYTWNDITYEKTGSYNQEFVAVNGADSIVTLHLTVFPETPATTEEVTIDFGTTYEWHGTVYGESGEYTITLQDENGCDYQAKLILTVLPEPEPSNPCVAASTLLEPVAQLTISLSDAQDIYRIDYQAWLASGVELIWSGAESLHTFVAEHCEFAVAIYHKRVVNYTEVPAHGNVILSKEILSGLSPYVDEDGYLYIRFLTEFEGQLSVIQPE